MSAGAASDPLPVSNARLRLRRLAPCDLAAFQAYRGDPEVGRWQGWRPMGEAAAGAFIAGMQASPFCPLGEWFQFGIADADDRLIGDIGVCLRADTGLAAAAGSLHAEIGFSLARAAQGRGLATEAVGRALALVFEHSAAQRIVAISDTRNSASLRLLQRLGGRCIAVLHAAGRDAPCREQHVVVHRPGRPAPRLRPAGAHDVAALAAVLIDARRELMPFVPQVHDDDDVRRWVAQDLLPRGGVTVACIDDRVAGLIAVAGRDAAGVAWIEQLSIAPPHAGAGLGSALLRQALARLPRPVHLFTFEANHAARAFYERHGFRIIARGDGSDNEERCPDLLYALG